MSFGRLPLSISHLFDIHCNETVNRVITANDVNVRIVDGTDTIIKITSDNLTSYLNTYQDVVNALAHTLDGITPLYCTEYMLQDEAGHRIGDSTTFSMQVVPDVAINANVANGDILTYQGGYWVNKAPEGISNITVDGVALTKTNRIISIGVATTTSRGVTTFANTGDTTSSDKLAHPSMVSSLMTKGFKTKLIVNSNIPDARWYLDSNSGTTYQCGTTLIDVTAGSHVVHFVAVPGYSTPANVTVNVSDDAVVSAYGTYTHSTVEVSVQTTRSGMYWYIETPANVSNPTWRYDVATPVAITPGVNYQYAIYESGDLVKSGTLNTTQDTVIFVSYND